MRGEGRDQGKGRRGKGRRKEERRGVERTEEGRGGKRREGEGTGIRHQGSIIFFQHLSREILGHRKTSASCFPMCAALFSM